MKLICWHNLKQTGVQLSAQSIHAATAQRPVVAHALGLLAELTGNVRLAFITL